MDGLHKLKTPGLFASLILQAAGVYLLVQATGVQSQRFADQSAYRRMGRDGAGGIDNVSSAQLNCSEGLAVYQWGAIACILVSIGSLSPHFLSRKKEENDLRPLPTFERPPVPDLPEPVIHQGVYSNLQKGLDELENCLRNQPVNFSNTLFLKTMSDSIRHLESRNKSTYDSLVGGHDEIQKAATRLQRLMEQCRESANYSATNRVDWKKNKLVDVLSQMRQSLENVMDLSKNITSIHGSTMRLMTEALAGDAILNDKISRAQEHLERIQNAAHTGNKVHDNIISVIGESRDNLTGATKFVGSLANKWDGLVHMTEQIDEIAEKINAQSLQASLEMARNSSMSSGVADLFPLGTELRSQAAKFHTYARHIKDTINEVRDEIHKTQQYLSQASAKSDFAFMSVNQCGEYYRSSISAMRYSASELVLLQQEVNIHMKKLQETKALAVNSSELMSNMDRYLNGQSSYSKKVIDETSQITVHSEKISTLLSKQYHELNHCQKILAQSAPLLSESIRFTTEIRQTISSLASCMERAVPAEESTGDNANDEVLVTKFEDFKQLIASFKESIEPEQAPKRSLPLQKAPWRVLS